MELGTGGTLSSINGTTLLSGSFSGLDTAALIEAALQVKRLPAVRLEGKITENEQKAAAFEDLTGLLGTLSSSLNALRNPPGLTGLSSNVFEQKAPFVSSSSTTAATDILGVVADNTASTGTYEVEVLQIAKAHKVSSGTIADTSAALGVTETLTVQLAGATAEESIDISVTSDMSAADVVGQINSHTATTGVRASLVKVADGDYRMVVTAEQTNKNIELSGDAGGTTLSALNLSSDNGTTYTEVLQAAQPAEIKLDGIASSIFRDNNEIDDVISGLTLQLVSAEPGTTITVDVESDLAGVREKILDFVNAYNEVRGFLKAATAIDGEDEETETALLFANNIVRSLGQDLGRDVAQLVGNLDDSVLSTLRGVGIELDGDNFLTVDEATLDSNLVGKLDEVRNVFEFGFQSDSADIRMIARKSKLELGDFTIEAPAGAIDGTTLNVTGYGAAFTVDGGRLIGLEGTKFEGLTLAYGRDTSDPGEAAENINISTSLGIAERLYQTVDNYTSPVDGVITDEVERLNAQIDDYEAEVAEIDARLVVYQQLLIEKYSRMEQAVAQAEALTNQLRAMMGISDDR